MMQKIPIQIEWFQNNINAQNVFYSSSSLFFILLLLLFFISEFLFLVSSQVVQRTKLTTEANGIPTAFKSL